MIKSRLLNLIGSMMINSFTKSADNHKLFFFCNNPLFFYDWLEINTLMQELLKNSSYVDMIDCLINFSTEEERNELSSRLRSFEIHVLNDYLDSQSRLKNLSDITKFMIEQLLRLSLDQHIDLNELKQKYDESISYHALPCAIRSYPTVFYHYHQHNQAVDDNEYEKLLGGFYEVLNSESTTSQIDQLVFCGGHGSSMLLNNLSLEQLHSLVNEHLTLFREKISFLVLESCMSAFHLKTFLPLLSKKGYVLCNFGEATARSYMDALELSNNNGSDLIDNIYNSAKYNPFLGLYSKAKRTLYLLRQDQVDTSQLFWKNDVRANKIKALKRAGINIKMVDVNPFKELLHDALNSNSFKNHQRLDHHRDRHRDSYRRR